MKKKIWFAPFRYVVPADFEQKLEELASCGYTLNKVSSMQNFCITLEKSAAQKYRYAIELKPLPTTEYMNTYKQFGWEFVGCMSSMYIWRKSYSDERPELFSDRSSQKSSSMRLVNLLSALLCIFALTFFACIVLPFILPYDVFMQKLLDLILGAIVSGLFCTYLLWAVRKIKKWLASEEIKHVL